MHHFELDLFRATEWVARYHKEVEARFLDALTRLPSFGPEVLKTGKTSLLAKRVIDPEMRREKVEVQLIDELELLPSSNAIPSRAA